MRDVRIALTRMAALIAFCAAVAFGLQFFFMPDFEARAQTQGGGFYFTPLGYCQQSVTSTTAVGLSTCSGGIPVGAKYAFIRVEQNLRWRDDGTAPSATTGQIINSTDVQGLFYSGRLSAIQFIAASTTGNLDVTFYGGSPP